jgi:hypothetical protein
MTASRSRELGSPDFRIVDSKTKKTIVRLAANSGMKITQESNMADPNKFFIKIGSKNYTTGDAAELLNSDPKKKAEFIAARKRGASDLAAFEYVMSLGEEKVADAAPEEAPAKKGKAPKAKKTGPFLQSEAPEAKAAETSGKEPLSTREANTDFGAKLTAKAFKIAKEKSGDAWRTFTPEQKLKLVLSVPQVSELRGSAAVGAIRALATRIGTTRGGEDLAPLIDKWGKERGVVKPVEEFGVTVRGVKEITAMTELPKEERSKLRLRTRTIAKRRGKGVKGGSDETRVSATEKGTAVAAVKATGGDALSELIEQIKADQAETAKNLQASSDEGSKIFLMETGEVDENGKPKKVKIRIDSKGSAMEPGRTRKGEAEALSTLGAKQNAEYEIASTREAWRAYNASLPKGQGISAKEFVEIEFADTLSAADRAKLARALSKLRQQERVERQSGKGVKPAKPKVVKLLPQTPEAGRAKLNAKDEIRVRKQNTPTVESAREPVVPASATRAVTKTVVSGEGILAGAAKPAKRGPKRVGTVTRKPTFQDAVLSQLAETGGKKDVRDFLALKALRDTGFPKSEVRTRAKQMEVSANVRKAAKASGLLSFAVMALRHLDGESKRKKKD